MHKDPLKTIHKQFFYPIFFLFYLFIGLFTASSMIVGLQLNGFLKYFLIFIEILAPILFVVSSVFYRYFDNLIVRVLYIIGAYVEAVTAYWFLSSLVLSIFSYYINNPYLHNISLFLYLFSTIMFVIGIIESFKIRIKKYTVKIPSQYPSLLNKKFILIADSHFGPVNQEIFARRIFKKIINLKPDAVLFPGDMFDSECYGDVEKLKKEIKVLTSIAPVFFTPGNHEQYGPFNHFMDIATDGGMTVLIDESVRLFGVPIFGINYKQNKKMGEIESLIKNSISSEYPSIVLNHEPVFHDLLSKAGAFLVVSGHTHNGQFWPGKYFTKFVYGKYSYGIEESNGLVSITTSGVGTFGPPMRTFNRPEIIVIDFV